MSYSNSIVSPRRQSNITNNNNSIQGNLWKTLMDKTSNEKLQRSENNYSARRTVENFLSGRTLNPTQFNQQANVLLVKDEAKREKMLKKCEANGDVVTSEGGITGCSRRLDPQHNKTNFKMKYNKEDLRQYLSQECTPSRRHGRDRSNQSHMRDMCLPAESSALYLGGSHIRCLLTDKSAMGFDGNQSTRMKNENDFKSNISCLSPDKSLTARTPNESSLSQVKQLRHLLTSFDNSSSLKSRKKKVQVPYESRQITNRVINKENGGSSGMIQTSNSNMESRMIIAGVKSIGRQIERSRSARPRQINNAFQSQITALS